ncbi:unnamed protein product [Urochloa humidicola]
MAPMAAISAPLAARASPSGFLSHRPNGTRARLGLRGVQFTSQGVSSQQNERIRCHSYLRQNTIVASANENPPLMPAIMTPAGPLDLSTVLMGNRVIFIGQYINSQVAQRVISQLVTLAAVDEESDILIYLNCPGGSLYSILAIYDCMSWVGCAMQMRPRESGTRLPPRRRCRSRSP